MEGDADMQSTPAHRTDSKMALELTKKFEVLIVKRNTNESNTRHFWSVRLENT